MRFYLRLITLLLVFSIFSTLSSNTFAQEDTVDDPGKQDAVKLEIVKGEQNPKTKEFELKLKVKSLIDTDRVRINWELQKGYIAPAKGQTTSDAQSIKADQEIFFTKRFKPSKPGVEEIRVRTTAFGPDPNYDYFSFTTFQLVVDGNLEVDAGNKDYQTAKSIMSILDFARIIGIGTAIFLLFNIIYWKFTIWMNTD